MPEQSRLAPVAQAVRHPVIVSVRLYAAGLMEVAASDAIPGVRAQPVTDLAHRIRTELSAA